MFYVYLLQSINFPQQNSIGFTSNLKTRIKDHNEGKSAHTEKYKPWKIVIYFGFEEENKAKEFEIYLKSGSGRSFVKRHFL